MFYGYNKLRLVRKSKFYTEFCNEFTIVMLSYEMMAFTPFVQSSDMQFLMGYAFSATIAWILLINIVMTLYHQSDLYILKVKQGFNQRKYESWWSKYKKVERFNYIMK